MGRLAYTVAPVKGVCSTYQDQGPDETQSSTAFNAQPNPSKTTVETRLPACFNDHNAPQSVVQLFIDWTRAADETLNGVIVVNRQRQRYSHTTTSKAIAWLVKRHLMMKVEQGGGRGVGSRYFIRWSFNHATLTQRRRAAYAEINTEKPAGYRITGNLSSYVEEKHISQKLSLNKFKTFYDVSPVENSKKREAFAKANSQQRRLRNERATRWALARLREVTTDPDALEASAKAIRRALRTGDVWIGPELAQFVALLADDLESLNDGDAWPEDRRGVFSFIGFGAWSVALRVYGDRRNEAEYQARQQEREEARRDPLPADFSFKALCEAAKATPPASVSRQEHTPNVTGRGVATRPNPGEKSGYQRLQAERAKAADSLSQLLRKEGVESISQLIRRQVATAGAVVRSDNRERRQRSEPYQRRGDLHSTAKSSERPATVYAAEPASIADMMSGYLEKLGGGEGVDEVAGNDNQ